MTYALRPILLLPMMRSLTLMLALPLVALMPLTLYGCTGGGDSPSHDPQSGLDRPGILAAEPPARASTAVAIVDGRPLRQADLAPLLLEIGGLQALTEAVLDQRLAARADERGIEITGADIAREETLLEASLQTDADSAARLVDTLRSDRGLGPVRYAALLRRNALLRAMVQPDVIITDEDIAVQFDLLHGEKRQPRIMTVPNLAAAVEVIRRMADGASFSDLAIEMSTDSSASRGGLLAPISRNDPSYPEPIRKTLWTLLPGDVSAPVMLDGSIAILQCERITPPSGKTFEEVRNELAELARLQRERILMETLARELIEAASITILDAELDRQWSGRSE